MADTKTPEDVRPEAKPQGTTADQVATMEAEGQGQTPVAPSDPPPPPRRPPAGPDAVVPPTESAAEDQAIDTVATGLVSSDEDEAGRP